jgi:hypothetical protein
MSASVFPSALRRHHGGDIDLDTPRRREPSKAALAMMTANQLRDYYQRRSEWQSADLEAIAEMRKADPTGLRRW